MTGSEDKKPEYIGVGFVAAGVIFVVCSCAQHMHRIHTLQKGVDISPSGSCTWALVLTCLIVASVATEMHFAFVYPYLKRSKVVELSGEEEE